MFKTGPKGFSPGENVTDFYCITQPTQRQGMYRAANSHRMRGGAIDIRWMQTLIPGYVGKSATVHTSATNYWRKKKTMKMNVFFKVECMEGLDGIKRGN